MRKSRWASAFWFQRINILIASTVHFAQLIMPSLGTAHNPFRGTRGLCFASVVTVVVVVVVVIRCARFATLTLLICPFLSLSHFGP